MDEANGANVGDGNVAKAVGPSAAAALRGSISLSLMSSGSKHWTAIAIPHTYMGNSFPIRVSNNRNEILIYMHI